MKKSINDLRQELSKSTLVAVKQLSRLKGGFVILSDTDIQ